MFPDSENSPAVFSKSPSNPPIALAVARQFVVPEFLIGRGPAIAFRATMPEASVNKYGDLWAPEYEVGASWQTLFPAPSGDLEFPEDFNKPQLCGFIPMTFDQGHHLGTFFFAPHVSHKPNVFGL